MGNLYIVATPIGNLQDITLRAIHTLRSVDVIACEDTRHTGNLLQMLKETSGMDSGSDRDNKSDGKKPRFVSYYEQNEAQRIPEIINLLKDGKNVALVSDAGTPTVSDPGFKLVRECIREGIKVESIPGPSAVIAALVVSGLPTDKFFFLGYLPKKEGHIKESLRMITEIAKTANTTVILYETPHRLLKTLQLFETTFGDIHTVVCSELTKLFENVQRGSVTGLVEHYSKKKPKGEFVILFHTKELGHS